MIRAFNKNSLANARTSRTKQSVNQVMINNPLNIISTRGDIFRLNGNTSKLINCNSICTLLEMFLQESQPEMKLTKLSPQAHTFTQTVFQKCMDTTGVEVDEFIRMIMMFFGSSALHGSIFSEKSTSSRIAAATAGILLLFLEGMVNYENISLIEEFVTRIIGKWELGATDLYELGKLFCSSGAKSRYMNFLYTGKMTYQVGEESGYTESLRKMIDILNGIKNTEFGKKFYKLLMYTISFGYTKVFNYDFSSLIFSKAEKEESRLQYNSKVGFALSLVDSILFLYQKGREIYGSRDLSQLFTSCSGAQAWMQKVTLIKQRANFLSNPEPHGFTWFEFVADLNDAIDIGTNIVRNMSSCHIVEQNVYRKALDDLRFTKAVVITKRTAQASRAAPFGLLLFGGSSVGKSFFTQILIKHYAKLFKLPQGDEYIYTRNANSEFWDGFHSSMWCVILDDIAFLKPDQGLDPSVTEMLQVVNNISFVPNQADLADKGRTPMKAELVIATTNTQHLNATAYFSCPLAIQRRLKYIIEIVPLPQYASADGKMLDPSKLPTTFVDYPNYWKIYVKVVTCAGDGQNRNRARITTLFCTCDIYEFIKWYSETALQHEETQKKAAAQEDLLGKVTICELCHLPSSGCACTLCTICHLPMTACQCEAQCEYCELNPRYRDFIVGGDVCMYNENITYAEEEGWGQWNNEAWVDQYDADHFDVNDLESESRSSSNSTEYWTNDVRDPSEAEYWSSSQSDSSASSGTTNSLGSAERDHEIHGIIFDVFKFSYCTRGGGLFPSFCWHCYAKKGLSLYYHTLAFGFYRWWWWRGALIFSQKWLPTWMTHIPNYFCKYHYIMRVSQDKQKQKKKALKCAGFAVLAVSLIFALMRLYKSYSKPEPEKIEELKTVVEEIKRTQTVVEEVVTHVEHDEEKPIDLVTPQVLEFQDVLVQPDTPSDELALAITRKFGGAPIKLAERQETSVWIKDSYVLTPMDINDSSRGMNGKSIDIFMNLINFNTAFVTIWCNSNEVRVFRVFCLGGTTYIANNHCVPDNMDELAMSFKFAPTSSVSANVIRVFQQGQFTRYPQQDLVVFEAKCLPVRKNLIDFLPNKSFKANTDGYLLTKDVHGVLIKKEVKNITFRPSFVFVSDPSDKHQINTQTDAWRGFVTSETRSGDCGSLLIGMSGLGPVILGFHYVGGGTEVNSVALTKELAQQLLPKYVVNPGIPKLSVQGYEHPLQNELHHKSTLRYVEGSAHVYGSFTGFRVAPKSHVEYTLLREFLLPYLETKVEFGRPQMAGWLPWHHGVKAMVDKPKIMNSLLLDECKDSYVSRLRGIDNWGNLQVSSLDVFTAINGQAGCKFIDSINRSTSMGEPYNKSKKFFLVPAKPVYEAPDPVLFVPEVMEEIERILIEYNNLNRVAPVFHAHLKDEAIKLQKIIDGKTRVFSGAPAAWSVVVRMMLLPCVKILQENKTVSEMAVGVACQNLEWEQLFEYVTMYGRGRMVAGDYQNYDKSMIAELILAAFDVLIIMVDENNGSEVQIKSIHCIAQDVAFAWTNFNGDLIEFFGSNPSGQPLTVIINCIVNSLLMRMAYRITNPDHSVEKFSEHVALLTYGDDNIMSVHQDAPWFNHTSIQAAMARLGIGYTMADKDAESKPYIDVDETSFLKRTWRFDEEVGAYVAPLELSSIEKMLTITVASRSITRGAQAIAIIGSAMREYFWYGKEKFEEKKALLKSAVEACNLQVYVVESTFPTWEELKSQFWLNSKGLTTKRLTAKSKNQKAAVKDSDCTIQLNAQCLECENGSFIETPAGAVPEVLIEGSVGWTRKIEALQKRMNHPFAIKRFGNICNKNNYSPKFGRRREPFQTDTIPTYEQKLHHTKSGSPCTCQKVDGECRRDRFRLELENVGDDEVLIPPRVDGAPGPRLYAQAGDEEVNGSVGTTEVTHETTITFLDETSGGSSGIATLADDRALCGETRVADLATFLGRPVKILTYTWNESDSVGTLNYVFPWSAFFTNANIQYKLNNFSFIRCNLKVKIMINASPFYYGALMASYLPLQTDRPDTSNIGGSTKGFIGNSQRPHAWLYPQNCEGTEMTLPFFYNRNWLNAQSNTDLTNMGVLDFINYTTLQSANGASGTGCTVTVYAWAENVHLAGPSAGLAAQAGDEYGQQCISSTASALAAVAGSLGKIPVIGPYATATEQGAKAISSIANRLGYCNPPVLDNVAPLKPTAVPPLASTEISYPVEKLTIDPKNELTIDPGVVGLPSTDELSIPHFVQRESYLTQTTWHSSDTSETILFSSAVLPAMFDRVVNTSYNAVYGTPISHISQMFRYWRGGIIFRFRFIASKYHKGRVRITYDPTGQGSNNIIALTATQPTCFTQVVDLGADTDVEVKIPYIQALGWLRTLFYSTTDPTGIWSTSSAPSFANNPGFSNGTIVMRVVTALTAPVASSNIQVLVSVRGAPDLEFAAPISMDPYTSNIAPQAGSIKLEAQAGEQVVIAGEEYVTPGSRFLANHGEAIVSLRQLFRRYNLNWIYRLANDTTLDSVVQMTMTRYPWFAGYEAGGLFSATSTIATGQKPYQFATNIPLTWIGNCFIASRGAVNWVFNYDSAIPMKQVRYYRTSSTIAGYASTNILISTTESKFASTFLNVSEAGCGGSALTNQLTNGCLTVSHPMYNNFLFEYVTPTNWNNATTLPSPASSSSDGARYNLGILEVIDPNYNANPSRIYAHVAAGTDFSLLFFINVPVVYTYAQPATV